MKKFLAALMILAMGIVVPNLADARNWNNDEDEDNTCHYCNGTGYCSDCGGSGTEGYTDDDGNDIPCSRCGGSGQCYFCGGSGYY